MRSKLFLIAMIACISGLASVIAARAQSPLPFAASAPLGNGFIYQGQLKQSNVAVDGSCEIVFRLYDNLVAGNAVGGALTKTVTVANGVFATHLDFGPGIFTGDARWLDAQVRCPDGVGSYTPLTPRQQLTAAPYALFANAVAAPLILSANVALPDAVVRATNSGGGNGVLGSAASHEGVGVYGTAPVTGVYGIASDNAGLNFGVAGRTDSAAGYGVHGIATADTGTAVYGVNAYYTATGALGAGTAGVAGKGPIGVVGNYYDPTPQSYGYLGYYNAGVVGQFIPASGAGVYGATANGAGVQAAILYSGTGDLFLGCITNFAACGPGFGGTVNLARIDRTGRGYFNGGTQIGGADVAEFIVASDAPQPGDVVEIDPEHNGQFRLASTPNSTSVAGVISTHAGMTMNARDAASATNDGPQLALVGRVPVKVSAENGAIRPGDLLVASGTSGHAMRAPTDPAAGTVIGKALGTLAHGAGVVEMLVMLR